MNNTNNREYLVKSMSAGASQMLMSVPLYFVGATRELLNDINLPNNGLGFTLSLLKPLKQEELQKIGESWNIDVKHIKTLKRCSLALQLGTAAFISFRAAQYLLNLGDEETALKDIDYSWAMAALNMTLPMIDILATAIGRLRLHGIKTTNTVTELHSIEVELANSDISGIIVDDREVAINMLRNNFNNIKIEPYPKYSKLKLYKSASF